MNWRNKTKLTRLVDIVAGVLIGSGIVVLISLGISFDRLLNVVLYYRMDLFVVGVSWFGVGLLVLVGPWISPLGHRLRIFFRNVRNTPGNFAEPIRALGRAVSDADRYAGLLSKLDQLGREKNLPADVYSKLREECLLQLKEALDKSKTDA